MKYVSWLLKAAIFFVMLAFALNNQTTVTVHFFMGQQWQAPMVLVVLTAMLLGLVLGMTIMLPLWLRARKETKLAKQASPQQPETTAVTRPSNVAPSALPEPHPPYGI